MEPEVPHRIPGVSSSVMAQAVSDSPVSSRGSQHPLPIRPINQMKSSLTENDYTDSPALGSQQLPKQVEARQHLKSMLVSAPQHSSLHYNSQNAMHPWVSFGGQLCSISSSVNSTTSSLQRTLVSTAPTLVADQTSSTTNSEPKPLHCSRSGIQTETERSHVRELCEGCGKCRCPECALSGSLPSCWLGQNCLCSAQNLVDSVTCMCLVRGVFYHCSDNEDESCADWPCSCSRHRRCARWGFMGTLALVLPCLACYLPAMGCAKLSQRCYDSVNRPGCRCKNSPTGRNVEGKTSRHKNPL